MELLGIGEQPSKRKVFKGLLSSATRNRHNPMVNTQKFIHGSVLSQRSRRSPNKLRSYPINIRTLQRCFKPSVGVLLEPLNPKKKEIQINARLHLATERKHPGSFCRDRCRWVHSLRVSATESSSSGWIQPARWSSIPAVARSELLLKEVTTCRRSVGSKMIRPSRAARNEALRENRNME